MDSTTATAIERLKRTIETEFLGQLDSLWLFGSRARGDHRPWSDIDLAVVLNSVETWTEAAAQRQRVSTAVAEIALETETVPSVRMIPRSAFESEKSGLVAAIKREGRRL